MGSELKPGMELYSIQTGRLILVWKRSRDAAEFICKQPGFMGVHIIPENGFLIHFFDSLNAAKKAKNNAEAKGIGCGRNIMRWTVADDGVPECQGVAK